MVELKESGYSFEGIREMSKEILNNSKDLLEIDNLHVDNTLLPRIHTYLEKKVDDSWLPEGHELPLNEECGLNLFYNVINFCYKDPESGHEYVYTNSDGKQIKRSSGLIAALANSGIDWNNFEAVSELLSEEWRKLSQISESNPMYLGEERKNKIVDFAKYLLNCGYEDIEDLFVGCNYDVTEIAGCLNKSGFFEDKFMKRSQLACRMINDVLMRRSEDPLLNIDQLTVMADYRIPQVFYNLGVVHLVDKDLIGQIVFGSPILANSREENALRATAVKIGKIVADKLGITEAETDSILWGLSQEMSNNGELAVPHMVVATDAY